MVSRVRASDRVHDLILEAIVSGDLPDGSSHSIYQLADRYGVSRTPVREAVLRLADSGLLDIERNQGFVVRGLRVDDVRQVFDLRLLIEVPLAGLAASRFRTEASDSLTDAVAALERSLDDNDRRGFIRDDRLLHRAIAELAGNSSAADVLESLRDRTESRNISTLDRERTLAAVHAEHLPVVDSIRAGDVAGASAAMRFHLIATGELLMKQTADRTGEESAMRLFL